MFFQTYTIGFIKIFCHDSPYKKAVNTWYTI
jgi:hypothetical protein